MGFSMAISLKRGASGLDRVALVLVVHPGCSTCDGIRCRRVDLLEKKVEKIKKHKKVGRANEQAHKCVLEQSMT